MGKIGTNEKSCRLRRYFLQNFLNHRLARLLRALKTIPKSFYKMKMPQTDPKLERMKWLLPLILLINATVLGLLRLYSYLNVRPFAPPHDQSLFQTYRQMTFALTFFLPVAASLVYLWPVFVWLRRLGHEDHRGDAPETVVTRAVNAPISLAAFTLFTWILVDILLLFRVQMVFDQITLGTQVHLIIRPLLAGLIASTAVFFLTENICRAHAWPIMLANTQIEGNPRLWKIRVAHRLFLLWFAISFLPLSTAALTAFMRLDTLHPTADPLHSLFMYAIILIGASAALGGAGLAWLLARSISRPLRTLEQAMARLRAKDFSVREPVSTTDEIGALAEGFNLMAERLSESYQALEVRNRELTKALERVTFLESIKRGLDRFVPDTVRRAIEANPDAPDLQKAPKDVTVLFLDIQGYTRLSEELPPEQLSELIERYFSLFLSDIKREGGDINETAGDGLMILFQDGPGEDHAASAVRTAQAIRDKTAEANRQDGLAHRPIAVNIGISSGECDVGSTRFQSLAGERWTFTATGPVTNLAARLRDHATDGQILLSAETARHVADRFQLRRLTPVTLKNITAPVELWELEDRTSTPRGCPHYAGKTGDEKKLEQPAS